MDILIDGLMQRLAGDLPGEAAQQRMAPPYRPAMDAVHPAALPPRQSAVLIYLFPQDSDWRIVLMKRPDYDGAHGGQVGIPGGRLEAGENYRQAAVREFVEETGVAVENERLLGRLSDLFIPSSNFLVRPFVAYGMERPAYSPDPVEVEEIIELKISSLLAGGMIRRGRVSLSDGVSAQVPFYDVQGHMVWGGYGDDIERIQGNSAPHPLSFRPGSIRHEGHQGFLPVPQYPDFCRATRRPGFPMCLKFRTQMPLAKVDQAP